MSSSRSFLRSHHSENCEAATKYALRVFLLRMLAVKNSQNRLPEFLDRKKIVGRLPAEAPTAASWRPEIGITLLVQAWFRSTRPTGRHSYRRAANPAPRR